MYDYFMGLSPLSGWFKGLYDMRRASWAFLQKARNEGQDLQEVLFGTRPVRSCTKY